MFVRYSTITGRPDRIDDLIAFVTRTVQPTVLAHAGCEGLGMWVQRESGEAVVGSLWTTRAQLDASEAAVTAQRAAAGELAGGTPQVDIMEVLLLDVLADQQPGSAVRALRITAEPGGRDEQLAWARSTIIPKLRTIDGYQSYVVHQGSAADQVLVTVAYRDAAAAEEARQATQAFRDAFADHGMILRTTTTYETALMTIAPRPTLTTPQTIDLTEPTKVR